MNLLRRLTAFRRIPISLLLPILLAGCYSTSQITVDYPLDSATVDAINRGGGRAALVMGDSQTVAVNQLTVDSVMARWIDGEWQAAPLVSIRSITFFDPDEYWSQGFKGVLYGGAVFGAIGLAEGLTEHRPGAEMLGQTLGLGVAGGLLALVTHDQWRELMDPRLCYTIRPARDAGELATRNAEKSRVEKQIGTLIPELNIRSRVGRLELGMMYGHGNSINAESDASDPRIIGGLVSFGIRVKERLEVGLEVDYASHTFRRTNADESVSHLAIMLTGTFFPLGNSGLFIWGGVGFGSYTAFATYTGSSVTIPHVTPASVTASGFAMCIGSGYDILLGDAWSLRPAIRYGVTSLSGLELNDKAIIATGRTSSLLTVSLSVVFRAVM